MPVSEKYLAGDPIISSIMIHLPRINPSQIPEGPHPDLVCIDEKSHIYKWNFDGPCHYAKYDLLPPYRGARDFRIRFYDCEGKFYAALFFNKHGVLKDVQLRLTANSQDYHNPDLNMEIYA